MCVNSRLRINSGALALWSRLKITLDGKPFVGSPESFFTALNWNYYDDRISNALRPSNEWLPLLSRFTSTLNGYEYPIFAEIKCNKCRECISEKVSNLQSRSVLEASQAKSMFFITFTYDDAHLPLNSIGVPTLNPQHITDFLKNTRNTFYRLPKTHPLYGINFRVVTCGEYGSTTKRPHYHLLVFCDKYVQPRYYSEFQHLFTQRWTCPHVLKAYKKPNIYVGSTNPTLNSLSDSLKLGRKAHFHLSPYQNPSDIDTNTYDNYRLVCNPQYHGYICDFTYCRNVVASAKYIMKYIAKWKLDPSEYYNPLDPDSNETLPHKPFLKTPKHIALGNTAINDDNIVNSVLQSRDNKITISLHSLGGAAPTSQLVELSIPQQFKNAICRPFSRYFPSVGLACHVVREAVNCLNRHKMYYDYSAMTKTMSDLSDVKPQINDICRNLRKTPVDPLFGKWIFNHLSEIESAFNDPRTYPYDISEVTTRNYERELAKLHAYLFSSPSACLFVLCRLLPIYGELPSYNEYIEFSVDRFMMFGSNLLTPEQRKMASARNSVKSQSLFNTKFNYDE